MIDRKNKDTWVHIRLDEDTRNEVLKLAEEEELKISTYIRNLIEEDLNKNNRR